MLVAPLPNDLLNARLLEIQGWTREYREWRAWFARWNNRREPGVWSWSTRPRREKPYPPAWLASTCEVLLEDQGPLAEGCRALAEWRDDDYFALVAKEKIAQRRADLEAPRKTVWWQHVHLDALWPMTQSGSQAFGVFGTHMTLPLTRRVHVFLAPGAILMRLPSHDGGRTWSTATDWGFSFKVCDFTMPVMNRRATAHLNLARVWLLGAAGRQTSRDLYLAGFSLTFNPRADSTAATP